MVKQVFNPFMPLNEYVPDGEPHVFNGRIYLFGSHDKENGDRYCQEDDYVLYSAPVDDLTDWRFDGVIYTSKDDPLYQENPKIDLYAPDVVCGKDGNYYLYYTPSGTGNDFLTPIHIAKANRPEGPYKFYGIVSYPDGKPFLEYLMADPAVIIAKGKVRLYFGWSLSGVAGAAHGSGQADHTAHNLPQEQLRPIEKMVFKASDEQLKKNQFDLMGANEVELAEDMHTVISPVSRIVPGQFSCQGTSFEGHAFYEASSIRHFKGKYYFIYSSQESNELCYAISSYPDRNFIFGGVLISNGDVGYQGRKFEDRLNLTANNHGSIEKIEDNYYVFYHRPTHASAFSRQACAEKIKMGKDGSFAQVEMTSSGLNPTWLIDEGSYSCGICCNLTDGKMPHITNRRYDKEITNISSENGQLFISGMTDKTKAVYKYFTFKKAQVLTLICRGTGKGKILVKAGEKKIGEIKVTPSANWTEVSSKIKAKGIVALTFEYRGKDKIDLLEFSFS